MLIKTRCGFHENDNRFGQNSELNGQYRRKLALSRPQHSSVKVAISRSPTLTEMFHSRTLFVK